MPTTQLNAELYWLTLTLFMTGLMWVPYIINRLIEQRPGPALWDPEGTTATRVGWAGRMMRAHQNAIENLTVFAPLVLALQLAQISTPLTAGACRVYFFARLAHYLIFSFGIPGLRIPAFAVGVAAQMALAFVLLGWQ